MCCIALYSSFLLQSRLYWIGRPWVAWAANVVVRPCPRSYRAAAPSISTVRRTASSPRRPLAADSRALAADVAESCPPPRRRRLAGESALDSAEVIGSSLVEAAGCTSGLSGLGPPSRPEDSYRTDKFVGPVALSAVRRSCRLGVPTRSLRPRGLGEGGAAEPLAIVGRVE